MTPHKKTSVGIPICAFLIAIFLVGIIISIANIPKINNEIDNLETSITIKEGVISRDTGSELIESLYEMSDYKEKLSEKKTEQIFYTSVIVVSSVGSVICIICLVVLCKRNKYYRQQYYAQYQQQDFYSRR